jgi:hypothetical protein
MTEPKDSAPDEPTSDGASDQRSDAADERRDADAEAARAEAEAAAQAANELDDHELATGATADAEPPDDLGDEPVETDDAKGDGSATTPDVGSAARAAPAIPAPRGSGRDTQRPGTKAATPAQVIDPSIRVGDRASAIFVLGTVAVFVLIFLNAMLLGTGGTLHPYVIRSPKPTASASVPASVAPSASSSPAASGSPSTSASPAPSGSAGPSAAPSTAPSASSSAPSAAPS